MKKSKFILVEHNAEKAGKHNDLRFKKPDSTRWASFATKDKLPIDDNDKRKVLLIKTYTHTKEDALFTGKIQEGYGKGTIRKIDGDDCIIEKYDPANHIIINFQGKKLKGRYHIINFKVISKLAKEDRRYLFFRAKDN